MPLDPQARMLLDAIAAMGVAEATTTDPVAMREQSAQRRTLAPPGPAASVRDYTIAGPGGDMLVRVYEPLDARAARPGLVWFHGGGFVIGSVAESDSDCRNLAVLADCVVASVEYRLAPEHPFPAGVNDSYAGLSWVHAHAGELGIDVSRLAVGGDSAGGNLAIACALRARERAGPELCLQLLLYPVIDLVSLDTPSYAACAEGYYLTREDMIWYREQYVPRVEDRKDPYVSPLHVASVAGLPPAWIATAEFDPLRDEGEAFAARLAAGGVEVEHRCYPGMIHGFFSMSAYLDGGKRVLADAAAAVKLGKPRPPTAA